MRNFQTLVDVLGASLSAIEATSDHLSRLARSVCHDTKSPRACLLAQTIAAKRAALAEEFRRYAVARDSKSAGSSGSWLQYTPEVEFRTLCKACQCTHDVDDALDAMRHLDHAIRQAFEWLALHSSTSNSCEVCERAARAIERHQHQISSVAQSAFDM